MSKNNSSDENSLRVLDLSGQMMTGIALNTISAAAAMCVPIVVKGYVDNDSQLIHSIVYIIGIFALQYLIGAAGSYFVTLASDIHVAKLRRLLMNHVIHLRMRFFDNTDSAETTSRIINDVSVLRSFMTSSIPEFVNGVVSIAISAIAVTLIDFRLTLILLVIFPVSILVAVPLGKFNEKNAFLMQGSISKLNAKTSEALRNIRAVKLDNAEEHVLSSFSETVSQVFVLSKKTDGAYSAISPIQGGLSLLFTAFVFIYGMMRVRNGSLSIGEFTVYIMFFFQLIGPIGSILSFYVGFKVMRGSTKRIFQILKETGENAPATHGNKLNLTLNKNPLSISLDNVSFSYDASAVLKNVSMRFGKGENIAIVGATGAGKTTIINLLTRLYPVTTGSVKIDGLNAEFHELPAWRELFGVVSQDNTILSGTMRQNLVFGLRRKPNEDQLNKAIWIAGLDDVIGQAIGLDTNIGEHGLRLSGGQRQRIQIARAYLRKARFLILDEATSNLDARTEALILQRLHHSVDGQTTISIAHRLSTIISADRIYYMENGGVQSFGSHQALMSHSPSYRKLIETQIIDATQENTKLPIMEVKQS